MAVAVAVVVVVAVAVAVVGMCIPLPLVFNVLACKRCVHCVALTQKNANDRRACAKQTHKSPIVWRHTVNRRRRHRHRHHHRHCCRRPRSLRHRPLAGLGR